jgi:enoyl-CoA hydratase
MYLSDYFAGWDRFAQARKPIIAAVNGFALGGGCELAMMCDIVIASDAAKFGQPEIKLGVAPGMGGSQRLTKAVGKAKAMDMILTGRMIDAAEADRIGLVSRVVPADKLMDEAMSVAETVASYSIVALMAAKEMTARALELPTTEGVKFERRLFQALFGTADQKEGMEAFNAKRKAEWKDQ